MAKVKEKRDEDGRIIIDSWDEVPQFKTEAEEQAWWDEHTIGETLLEGLKPVKQPEPGQNSSAPSASSHPLKICNGAFRNRCY